VTSNAAMQAEQVEGRGEIDPGTLVIGDVDPRHRPRGGLERDLQQPGAIGPHRQQRSLIDYEV